MQAATDDAVIWVNPIWFDPSEEPQQIISTHPMEDQPSFPVKPHPKFPDPSYFKMIDKLRDPNELLTGTSLLVPRTPQQKITQNLKPEKIHTTRARQGQDKWNKNFRNVMNTRKQIIESHPSKDFFNTQIKRAEELKFKKQKISVLAFLQICAVQDIIKLQTHENTEKGFLGITSFSVNPDFALAFINRFYALKEGKWLTPEYSQSDDQRQLKLHFNQINALHNIFRNIKLIPLKSPGPAAWNLAFSGERAFVSTQQ